ncbi:amidohydrolase-like protein [Candidatus Vecturithrix granuli]|uniref:Amidohydrolase-like protein n=1 Tax=Vecturithrix granuli TaxID=1499967 RepID=A0A081C0Y3_VECG1|nr:amidohydrolase-like protein [Candidatus Vecturithrix granuli]
MKVTVCELRNDLDGLKEDWQALVSHVQANASEFVLLPEMPFFPWLARTREVDPARWEESMNVHEAWIARLTELAPASIAATRPVLKHGKRLNEAFVWQKATGYAGVHTKYYLPDEAGFWEASWYERGAGDFAITTINNVQAGFLICTELWFNKHAREYVTQGIHLLLCPRVTPQSSIDKWIAGGRTAAVVSGAFCLSSNLVGTVTNGVDFGGAGWIIEPEEGTVLGVTSQQQPFLTLDIDLRVADAAKHTYPRYVRD